MKKDVRNVRPKTTNFKEVSQQQFVDKIMTPKKESSLPSKLSAVDRSNLVKVLLNKNLKLVASSQCDNKAYLSFSYLFLPKSMNFHYFPNSSSQPLKLRNKEIS